jgi:hypothetical protein
MRKLQNKKIHAHEKMLARHAARALLAACGGRLGGAASALPATACEGGLCGSLAAARRGHTSSSGGGGGGGDHLPRPTQDTGLHASNSAETTKWSLLREQGHDVNPCNSK